MLHHQRQLLQIKWHRFIWIDETSATTGLPSISETISRHRNALFGHVARLPEADDVPAHKALNCQVNLSLGRHQAASGIAVPVVLTIMGWPDPELQQPTTCGPLESRGVLSVVVTCRLRDDNNNNNNNNNNNMVIREFLLCCALGNYSTDGSCSRTLHVSRNSCANSTVD